MNYPPDCNSISYLFNIYGEEDNFLYVCVPGDTTVEEVINDINEMRPRVDSWKLVDTKWDDNPYLCGYDNVSLHYALECFATTN